jgi:hypothetical protein
VSEPVPAAGALALPALDIPPEYRDGVAVQLAALLAQARLVQDFPLPDDLEPAPVFTPR